jgi:cyclohexa-1,5-dienecarbonyl-CoA hydratase
MPAPEILNMEKIKLSYSHGDSVARIILDDGKGNVLDNAMMLELLACLSEFEKQKQLKIIVIEGAGKHFSFGASVEEHTAEFAEAMLQTFHKLILGMVELQIPFLAKISGQCLGGGLELALACNLMFADKSARMGQPEIVLGVFPPPASVLLPLKIGYARSEELLISGRSITAEEAFQIGLANYLFDDKDALEAGVSDWIEKYIIPKSASSIRFATKAGRIKFRHILSNFLPQLEFIYLRQLMQTHDANEGISAFIEKRQPVWKNE